MFNNFILQLLDVTRTYNLKLSEFCFFRVPTVSLKAEIVVNRLGETDRGSADNVALSILLARLLDVSADFSEGSGLVVDVVELLEV